MPSISSPCTGICTIDPACGLCLGCGRSVDEIVAWGRLSEPERRAIMAELPARLDEAAGPGASPLDADAPRP